MTKINSYKDLIVWQKSKTWVSSVYKITEEFPKSEQFGLTSQLRRSAVSIPSNIAEGFYRGTKKDKVQFLRIAFSSGAEAETQIEISKDLGFISDSHHKELVNALDEIMKMLNKIINKSI